MRLSKAYNPGLLYCSGQRPWLGSHASEECGGPLRLLVRTASNSYFSQVVSALSVPEPNKEVEEAVQEHWETLKVASAETLPVASKLREVRAQIGFTRLEPVGGRPSGRV